MEGFETRPSCAQELLHGRVREAFRDGSRALPGIRLLQVCSWLQGTSHNGGDKPKGGTYKWVGPSSRRSPSGEGQRLSPLGANRNGNSFLLGSSIWLIRSLTPVSRPAPHVRPPAIPALGPACRQVTSKRWPAASRCASTARTSARQPRRSWAAAARALRQSAGLAPMSASCAQTSARSTRCKAVRSVQRRANAARRSAERWRRHKLHRFTAGQGSRAQPCPVYRTNGSNACI